MTQAGTRYGCFLPDLTGLARGLPIADLPPHYIRRRAQSSKHRLVTPDLLNQSAGAAVLQSRTTLESIMKTLLILTALLATPVILSASAEAKGCIKGAIVGGVAGHMAGHGKMGAAAGCVIGHHEANKKANNTQGNGSTNQH